LGGLIVKRALIVSHESGEVGFRDIELSTGGIVFFGTPGSNISADKLDEVVRMILQLSATPRMLGKKEKDAVRNDAQHLKTELEAFKPISSAIAIFSFCEAERTKFPLGSWRSGLVRNPTLAHFLRRKTSDRERLSIGMRFNGRHPLVRGRTLTPENSS
jgi:hypothetical protein